MRPLYTNSLQGLEIGIRPGHSLPPPESMQFYANKPLPSVPPPPPPGAAPAMRIPRKPVASGDSRQTASRKRMFPNQDHKTYSLPPPRIFSGFTAHSSTPDLSLHSHPRHQSSHPIQHHPGNDDITDIYPASFAKFALGSASRSSTSSSSRNNRQSYETTPEMPFASFQSPRSSHVPPLEPDVDGISSKNSSWGPQSPQSTALGYIYSGKAVMHRGNDPRWSSSLSVCSHAVFDEHLPYEYHNICADLAHSPEKSPADEMGLLHSPPTQAPSASCVSFFSEAQPPRRRDPPRSTNSSATSGIRPQRTPYPHQSFFASQLELSREPQSAFDSDSDDDEIDIATARETIRSLLRGSDRRSSIDSKASWRTSRRPESLAPSIKAGRHISGLFTSAKELWKPVSKTERQREDLRKQIKVLSAEDEA